MNNLENSLIAFERLMEQLSDEKLDFLISKIDSKGITGPTVDEYFGNLNNSISAFYREKADYTFDKDLLLPNNRLGDLLGTVRVDLNNYIIENVLVRDNRQEIQIKQGAPSYITQSEINEFIQSLIKTAVENNYAMAA